MRYFARKTPLLVVTLLVTLEAFAQPEPKGLQGRLDAPVKQYSLSASGMLDALAKFSEQFKLPMGIEWVKDKKTSRGLILRWEDNTVRGVLNSVVSRYPGYGWLVQNGVVHVFRHDLVTDGGNFLNLNVPKWFEAKAQVGGMIVRDLQLALQSIVSPRKLPPDAGIGGSYTSGNVAEKRLTLELGGLPVRAALDKLVNASEHKIWVVTFSGPSDRTSTGFCRTETLWHPTPFPDRDQPMWDSLTWQEFERMTSPGGA